MFQSLKEVRDDSGAEEVLEEIERQEQINTMQDLNGNSKRGYQTFKKLIIS